MVFGIQGFQVPPVPSAASCSSKPLPEQAWPKKNTFWNYVSHEPRELQEEIHRLVKHIYKTCFILLELETRILLRHHVPAGEAKGEGKGNSESRGHWGDWEDKEVRYEDHDDNSPRSLRGLCWKQFQSYNQSGSAIGIEKAGGKLPTPKEQLELINKRREAKKSRSGAVSHS